MSFSLLEYVFFSHFQTVQCCIIILLRYNCFVLHNQYNIYNDNLIIKLMMIDRCFVVIILLWAFHFWNMFFSHFQTVQCCIIIPLRYTVLSYTIKVHVFMRKTQLRILVKMLIFFIFLDPAFSECSEILIWILILANERLNKQVHGKSKTDHL